MRLRVDMPGRLSAIRPAPQKKKKILCEGHPHTSGKGASPFCIPHVQTGSGNAHVRDGLSHAGKEATPFCIPHVQTGSGNAHVRDGLSHPGKGATPLCTPHVQTGSGNAHVRDGLSHPGKGATPLCTPRPVQKRERACEGCLVAPRLAGHRHSAGDDSVKTVPRVVKNL